MSTHPRPHPLHWRLRGEIQPPLCPRQGRPTIRWESAPSGPGAGRLREGAGWGAPGRDRRSPSGFSKGSCASAGAGRGPGPGARAGRSPKDAPSGRCRRITRPGTGPPAAGGSRPRGLARLRGPRSRLPSACKTVPERSAPHLPPQAPGSADAAAANAKAGRRAPRPGP